MADRNIAPDIGNTIDRQQIGIARRTDINHEGRSGGQNDVAVYRQRADCADRARRNATHDTGQEWHIEGPSAREQSTKE